MIPVNIVSSCLNICYVMVTNIPMIYGFFMKYGLLKGLEMLFECPLYVNLRIKHIIKRYRNRPNMLKLQELMSSNNITEIKNLSMYGGHSKINYNGSISRKV